jgi:hypothetical protein
LGYSNLAETLLDHARAEAKRSESRVITRIHLLSAFRRWSTTQFDDKFPNKSEEIARALSQLKRDGVSPDGPDEETREILEKIWDADDIWEIAGQLLGADLAGFIEEKKNEASIENRPLTSTETEKPESSAGLKIDISSELAVTIASILTKQESEIREVIGHDMFVVAKEVLSSSGEIQFDTKQFLDVCEIPLPESGVDGERSSLLSDLIACNDLRADGAARQYALGLVSTASFAASLDANVTQQEIDAIDNLRIELRNELAKGLSATSTSHLTTFDELFGGVVGLEQVKKELRQRIDYYVVAQRRRARGLSTTGHAMHMAFLGNPGTGKTTVARLFSKVLNEMSLLASDKLIEVDRSGLVGEYVGHSEKKTNDVIDSALGGVLFIDEAYSLVDEGVSGKSYGDLAIDVLVKRMEDDRDNLMVVVAGYDEPMRSFLDSNQGLNSRIPLKLHFADYTPEQLVKVAERFASEDGFVFDDSCRKKFEEAAARISTSKNCSNARDMRNVYEQSVRNQFTRLAGIGDLATSKELVTLTDEDVPEVELPKNTKQIGFR